MSAFETSLASFHELKFASSAFLFTDNHFVDDYAHFSTLDTKKKSTAVANSMNYMTKKGNSLS